MTKDLPYYLAAAFILLGALWHSNARSDTAIHFGGYSTHLLTEDATNESHDAALIEYGSWIAGRFNNSYGRESYTVGYGWSRNWGNWRGAVHVGAVKGYRECFGDKGDGSAVCPMAVPSLSYTRYRFQPEVMLLGDAVVAMVRIEL